MIRPPRLRRAAARLLAGTALGLLAASLWAATPATTDPDARFAEAKAAFDSASGSKDVDHEGYVRAYTIWVELAADGDARALYHLGIMHMFGLGGAEFDQALGMQKVRAAAEAGYPLAQSYMGLLAEQGDGTLVRRGDQVALEWWRKGAEGNHCVAVRRMARAYANGELGLAPDPGEAAQWEAREAGCRRN